MIPWNLSYGPTGDDPWDFEFQGDGENSHGGKLMDRLPRVKCNVSCNTFQKKKIMGALGFHWKPHGQYRGACGNPMGHLIVSAMGTLQSHEKFHGCATVQ